MDSFCSLYSLRSFYNYNKNSLAFLAGHFLTQCSQDPFLYLILSNILCYNIMERISSVKDNRLSRILSINGRQ